MTDSTPTEEACGQRFDELTAIAANAERIAEVLAALDTFVALRKKDHAHDDYSRGIESAVADIRRAITGWSGGHD